MDINLYDDINGFIDKLSIFYEQDKNNVLLFTAILLLIENNNKEVEE